MDVECAIMAETGSLERLKNYFKSFGDLHGLRHLNLDFSRFADKLPEVILYSDWNEPASIKRFEKSLKKWLKDPYDMVDAMFSYDVGYNANNVIQHYFQQRDAEITEVILSVYKPTDGESAIKDPERVENVREQFEKINDEENLDLHFDHFFKNFPNRID